MGNSRKHLPFRRRLYISFRRRTDGLRKAAWAVRRFFTLEARPEDIKLRREVMKTLDRPRGLMFVPYRQIEKELRIALGEYND